MVSELGLALPLVLLALPLSLAAAKIDVLPGDVALTRALQDWGGSALDRVAVWLSWIGDGFPPTALLALALTTALARAGYRAEALLIAAAALVRLVSTPLKAVFDSPRPTPDLARIVAAADGLGFPSGHALGAMVFYGALAVIAATIIDDPMRRRSVQVVAVTMILAMGWARVRVGAHWPSDVVGGYLWGGTILVVLAAGYRGIRT